MCRRDAIEGARSHIVKAYRLMEKADEQDDPEMVEVNADLRKQMIELVDWLNHMLVEDPIGIGKHDDVEAA